MAWARVPIDQAVAGLRDLAGGGGDLLAETAGVTAAWTARVDTGDHLVAAGLLVLAGPDHDQIARGEHLAQEAPHLRHGPEGGRSDKRRRRR